MAASARQLRLVDVNGAPAGVGRVGGDRKDDTFGHEFRRHTAHFCCPTDTREKTDDEKHPPYTASKSH